MNKTLIEIFSMDEVKTTMAFIISPFLGLIWSPLSIVLPFLIWLSYKDKLESLRFYAKELINLYINLFVLTLAIMAFIVFFSFGPALFLIPALFSFIAQVVYLKKAYDGEMFHMPLTHKFMQGL